MGRTQTLSPGARLENTGGRDRESGLRGRRLRPGPEGGRGAARALGALVLRAGPPRAGTSLDPRSPPARLTALSTLVTKSQFLLLPVSTAEALWAVGHLPGQPAAAHGGTRWLPGGTRWLPVTPHGHTQSRGSQRGGGGGEVLSTNARRGPTGRDGHLPGAVAQSEESPGLPRTAERDPGRQGQESGKIKETASCILS